MSKIAEFCMIRSPCTALDLRLFVDVTAEKLKPVKLPGPPQAFDAMEKIIYGRRKRHWKFTPERIFVIKELLSQVIPDLKAADVAIYMTLCSFEDRIAKNIHIDLTRQQFSMGAEAMKRVKRIVDNEINR